jgi:hypothetical protein
VQALGLRVLVSLVMARQLMPKALSPLQSVQRSYTSELSVVVVVVAIFRTQLSDLVTNIFGRINDMLPS